jgi:hypothetical protein
VDLAFFSLRGLLQGEEGATEDVRSFFATLPTAQNAWETRERRSGGLVITSSNRTGRSLATGRPGPSANRRKPEARRQTMLLLGASRESRGLSGARVGCRLQMLGRRIFPLGEVSRKARSASRGSLPWRAVRRRRTVRFAAGEKGAGFERASQTVSLNESASAARHEDRANGRRPVSDRSIALTR